MVLDVIKSDKILKQDAYDRTAELLKPTIDVQKEVKKSIDDKKDKLSEQLQKNQKAITSGLEDLAMLALLHQLPAPTIPASPKLSISYKRTMM